MVEKSQVLDAVKKALEASPKREFTQTVELAINLKDVDLANPKNRIEEDIVLPKGRGRPAKVGIFASSATANKAKGVADVVITPEELNALAGDKRKARKVVNSVNYFVAEAPLMPTIGKTLGVVLGPRGKMPAPIPPGADPTGPINNLRTIVKVKSRDKKTFHTPVGTATMPPEDLAENISVVLDRVLKHLERGRLNIGSVYVKTTMGPAIKVPV